MKKFSWAFLGLFLAVPAQSQYLNPPTYPTRDDVILPADKIEVRGTFRVLVLAGTGERPLVRFQGAEELLKDATATVSDGTLTIAFKDDKPYSSNPGSRISAVVYLPSVTSVKSLRAPAQIDVYGNNADEFSAQIEGAGQISVDGLEAKLVNVTTRGSGSIRLVGTAEEARYATGGSGSIEGKRLRVSNAKVAIGGSGSVYADVSESADVVVDGSGRVEIVGGARCIVRPANSNKVECR